MSKLKELAKLGQSIWYDFIERDLITSGKLKNLIEKGLRGITSNPTIFDHAISKSSDYDFEIEQCINKNISIEEIYESLALKDISLASDLMNAVYNSTNGNDGFVSIEVNPKYAYDSQKTIQEAKRLFEKLNRSNVMIKIPATSNGLLAITETIANGINVNCTLIFDLKKYKLVAEAYVKGLEILSQKENDLSRVNSVASFFVSRVDTAVDKELSKIGNKNLLGKIAVANAKLSTEIFNEVFSSEKWKRLASKGAKVQRLLWASTGTKNPDYSDVLYVDELIGENTINTIPPATLINFIDHGKVELTLNKNITEAKNHFVELKNLNIDLEKINEQLLKDGVIAFEKSFDSLINGLEAKVNLIKEEQKKFKLFLFKDEEKFQSGLNKLREEKIVERIWQKDFTIWKNEPTEIVNRLDWLNSPNEMLNSISEINSLVETIKAENFETALLLGMGGSSLAPEVFSLTFGKKIGYLDLFIVDSTNPDTIINFSKKYNPEKTLCIVSTKSGGTVETFSLMKYFYNVAFKQLGKEKVGNHFIAITDPGSGLEQTAKELNFRKIFLNNPNIGGRYSALSFFGLMPAGLLGIDLNLLLNNASKMALRCKSFISTASKLGCAIAELSLEGKDKLTFILSKQIESLGSWIEQLIAESTGKDGKGIVPIDGEKLIDKNFYKNDRLFVYIHLKTDLSSLEKIEHLKKDNHPVIEIILDDICDLAGSFFMWEIATAIASWRLKINPFDQPNVESAKILARNMAKEYQSTGKLQFIEPCLTTDEFSFYGNFRSKTAEDLINNFFSFFKDEDDKDRSYISIQAYLQQSEIIINVLQKLRTKIQMKYNSATTVGFGPRFLHSTGQLHKGDAGKGLFIQLISTAVQDINIPDNTGDEKSSISFGVLIKSQALGDRQALLNNNRNVLTIEIKKEIVESINKIVSLI